MFLTVLRPAGWPFCPNFWSFNLDSRVSVPPKRISKPPKNRISRISKPPKNRISRVAKPPKNGISRVSKPPQNRLNEILGFGLESKPGKFRGLGNAPVKTKLENLQILSPKAYHRCPRRQDDIIMI